MQDLPFSLSTPLLHFIPSEFLAYLMPNLPRNTSRSLSFNIIKSNDTLTYPIHIPISYFPKCISPKKKEISKIKTSKLFARRRPRYPPGRFLSSGPPVWHDRQIRLPGEHSDSNGHPSADQLSPGNCERGFLFSLLVLSCSRTTCSFRLSLL